ncbi:unnamed protein product [Brachionus calyciflorus]|uniref:Phospholipase B1, membrane-associated n=1 Tax=Brachionus calyciflorus TaxID=104777 RepID=A0A814MZ01_9BILA|nr:unnamed protein product [Brachionus calyciflorus]
MNFIKLVSFFMSISFFNCAEFNDEYYKLIEEHALETNELMANITSHRIALKNEFKCPRPTSVHTLRPNDIEIIGALGDSLTAANGAKAFTYIGLLEEYRGFSWSIGGQIPDLNKSITLPKKDILRKFNDKIYGASIGSGNYKSKCAVFNFAQPGKTSWELLSQANEMIDRMNSTKTIDFLNSWKLITIFIGGNDLCKFCTNKTKYTSDNYIKNIRTTLDYLKENLPRALINLVSPLDVSSLEKLSAVTCRIWQMALCSCALLKSERGALLNLTKEVQTKTEVLINSGIYDTSDDFTVVIQPFMKNVSPAKNEGSIDYSYFAPDCLHFSVKGHEASAIELWNSMLTPVGLKPEKWINIEHNLLCPTKDSPYIFTNKNSKKKEM